MCRLLRPEAGSPSAGTGDRPGEGSSGEAQPENRIGLGIEGAEESAGQAGKASAEMASSGQDGQHLSRQATPDKVQRRRHEMASPGIAQKGSSGAKSPKRGRRRRRPGPRRRCRMATGPDRVPGEEEGRRRRPRAGARPARSTANKTAGIRAKKAQPTKTSPPAKSPTKKTGRSRPDGRGHEGDDEDGRRAKKVTKAAVDPIRPKSSADQDVGPRQELAKKAGPARRSADRG